MHGDQESESESFRMTKWAIWWSQTKDFIEKPTVWIGMLTKPIYITEYLKVGPLSKLECLPNFSCETQYLKVGPALKEVAAGHQEEVAAANEVGLSNYHEGW